MSQLYHIFPSIRQSTYTSTPITWRPGKVQNSKAAYKSTSVVNWNVFNTLYTDHPQTAQVTVSVHVDHPQTSHPQTAQVTVSVHIKSHIQVRCVAEWSEAVYSSLHQQRLIKIVITLHVIVQDLPRYRQLTCTSMATAHNKFSHCI